MFKTIGGISALEYFRYDRVIREEFSRVEKVLLQYSKEMLKSERLGKTNDNYTITSLRGFQMLKDISLDIQQRFDKDSECTTTALVNLSNTLPASIRKYKIIAEYTAW